MLLVVLLTACGVSNEALEFTELNEEGFLAACTQTSSDIELDQGVTDIDNALISNICQCVWDETSTELTFEDFESLDTQLLGDSSANLPVGIERIIADCVAVQLDL